MSIGIVRALITLILFVAFVSLWAWAWRKRRHADFHAAALLAIEDDQHTLERSEQT